MLHRRKLLLASGLVVLGAATVGGAQVARPLFNFIRSYGKRELDSAGRPWSYTKTGGVERFEVRPGDHWSGEAHKERSEIAVRQYMPDGKDIWQSFSLMIEPSPPSTAEWRIFGQWHAMRDPWDAYVSPSVAFVLKGETFVVWTSSDPDLRQTLAHYPPTIDRCSIENFPRGIWHHFVIRLRFGYTGRGLLQVWRNGESIVDLQDIPIGYNDLIGQFFKYGVYRPSGDPDGLAARYANFEMGFDSLQDRIANPIPV